MKLKLKRIAKRTGYTIGKLYVDGVYFCDTLEDRVRNLQKEKKVMHETAIPEGTYEVVVNYSPKFKRRLPRLLDVPHFEGILIHRGGNEKHTSGCILVGENRIVGGLVNSAKYEKELTAVLARSGRNEITIE